MIWKSPLAEMIKRFDYNYELMHNMFLVSVQHLPRNWLNTIMHLSMLNILERVIDSVMEKNAR